MSRLTKRILLTALLGLFLTAPGVVRSQGFDAKTLMRAQQRGQTGSLYGNNPFEQPAEEGEEGEQQPQDTTKKERRIRMEYAPDSVSQKVKILFPIIVTIIAGIAAPRSVALIGFLMFGNLIRECGVLNSLSETAQKVLANLITIFLGIVVLHEQVSWNVIVGGLLIVGGSLVLLL